jgi:hypothetical protein
VRGFGGAPVNRKDPRWADIFTPVPDDPAVGRLGAAGADFVAEARDQAGGDRLRGLPRRRAPSRAPSSCSATAAS